VAQSNPWHSPVIFFVEWDIKRQLLEIGSSEQDAWHFCYMLSWVNKEDQILIMKPTCLQMGWLESPPLYCSASETAQDIFQEYSDSGKDLPQHPLEALCIPIEN